MFLFPAVVPIFLSLSTNSLFKQSVPERGTIKLSFVACMCSPYCMVPQWYCSVVVVDALRNECKILINTHSFKKTKYCGVKGSHISLCGEHRKVRGKSAKPAQEDTKSESDTGLEKAFPV